MKKKLLSVILIFFVLFGDISSLPLTVSAEQAGVTEAVLNKSTQGNPIIGFDGDNNLLYAANPSVLVDGDTVYLYVGHDVTVNGGYTMPEYLCYSTTDMKTWTYHGAVMKMADVSWAVNAQAGAAQAIKYKDKYYLLYCSERNPANGGDMAVAVAVADTPTGPFRDIGILVEPDMTDASVYGGRPSFGWEDIAPTVWVDEEGAEDECIYMAWGNTNAYMCELEIDGETVNIKDVNGDGKILQDSDRSSGDIWYQHHNIPQAENAASDETYTESPYLYRRQNEKGEYYGKYYLFFAMHWREEIGYATSDNLKNNTWTYRGRLMEPTATSDTNRPAVFDFKGRTYFVYHNGSLPGGNANRRAICVEEMLFNENGTINYIQETSTGLDGFTSTLQDGEGNLVAHESFENKLSASFCPIKDVRVVMDSMASDSDAAWEIVPGKADKQRESYVSIESYNKPGCYLMANADKNVVLSQDHNSGQEAAGTGVTEESEAMTFRTLKGFSGTGITFESVKYPGYYLTAKDGVLTVSNMPKAEECSFIVSDNHTDNPPEDPGTGDNPPTDPPEDPGTGDNPPTDPPEDPGTGDNPPADPPEDMQEVEPVISACLNFGGSGSDTYKDVTAVENGYVAVGYSAKASFGNGDWTGTENKGTDDAVIVKYDTIGKILWKKHFGGSYNDYFYAVTAVEDGYIAAGYSDNWSFKNGDWKGIAGKGGFDATIVKYDTAGNMLWRKNFGGKGEDIYYGVTAVEDGCVAVGECAEDSFGNGDWTGENGIGKSDAIIVKYDTNGNVQWQKHAGGNSYDEYKSVTAAEDGCVAAGSFISGGWDDAVMVKYDMGGNVLWEKRFGGDRSDAFEAIVKVGDGYVAAGYAQDFGSGDWKGIKGKGGYDAIIVKFDDSGNVLWKKNFGGSSWDYYNAIAADKDGYVAAGYSWTDSFGSGDWQGVKQKGGTYDAAIVKYDTAGNVLWKKNFGGNDWDRYDGVAVGEDSYIAVGYSNESSFGNGDWSGVKGKGGSDAVMVTYKKTFAKVIPEIRLSENTVNLTKGGKKQLSYTLKPIGTPAQVTFTTSNPSVATVDRTSGLVTAVGNGTAVITVSTDGGLRAFCTVVVYTPSASNNKPTSISLSSKAFSLKKGNSKKLAYTLRPSNASATVTFTSSNPSVATVDRNGTVTAKKKGTATITAKTSGLTASCKVTVTEAVKLKTPSLTVNLNSANGVKLSWKKVSGAQGYYVYRATSKNGSYKQIKKLKGTSYVNNKLKSGKTYYYKVAAYKDSTLSAKSKVKSKKIIGNLKTPKLKITANTEFFTISWNAVKGADKIEIYREARNGGFKKWKTIPAKNKKVSYPCSSQKKGVEYHFALRAYYSKDGRKIDSGLSNAVTFKR